MLNHDEFQQAIEIIHDRFYFVPLSRNDCARTSRIAQLGICYCIDNELVYEPFYADFGPLNMGLAYRFCQKTGDLLQEAERVDKKLYYCCGPTPQQRSNAAVLVGMFQVLLLNRTPESAYGLLRHLEPFMPFRDASCGVPTFNLTPLDCVRGCVEAKKAGFIDWGSPSQSFDVDEYEHFEQVENGDLNWIVPGKLLAFSGPASSAAVVNGYRPKVPEDYWTYFKKKGVTTVVRLNKPMYDASRFKNGGFSHHEMYFPDGSCPSREIRDRFLSLVENTPGAVAVHCKAGLGRTGVLICCYMIKHFHFTAQEAIGYIRICRPGSVIGPQQNYLIENAPFLLQQTQGVVRTFLNNRTGVPESSTKEGAFAASETSGRYGSTTTTSSSVHPEVDPEAAAVLACKLAPSTPAPTGKITRLLAANGQPRKVPTALFNTPASKELLSDVLEVSEWKIDTSVQ